MQQLTQAQRDAITVGQIIRFAEEDGEIVEGTVIERWDDRLKIEWHDGHQTTRVRADASNIVGVV